jgi:hypothetical protein
MNRRILFIMLTAGIVAGGHAHASVTKVGNGNDGADLEALSPINSGPIVEARVEALERLKNLNVIGVAGLGLLIPELERSEMLMAAQDVHPTGEPAGVLEISPDRSQVYARTFAEPYAATRFFPAALKLKRDQMVALHIHEALHRSLPAAVRENEDVVMHITMALTSPGANHDRVRQVVGLYVRPIPVPVTLQARLPRAPETPLPADSKSKFALNFESYLITAYPRPNYQQFSQGLDFSTSLGGYQRLGSLALEPNFRVRMKMMSAPGVISSLLGPSAFDLAARTTSASGALSSAFVRFSAKSLNAYQKDTFNRDIWTIGLSHQRKSRRSYLEAQAFYSLSSTVPNYGYSDQYSSTSGDMKYLPILSLVAHGGWTLKKWRLGGLAELHASDGHILNAKYIGYDGGLFRNYRSKLAPFRLIVMGPEFGFHGDFYQFKMYVKHVLNPGSATLTDLGDIMDRGAGNSTLGLTLATLF